MARRNFYDILSETTVNLCAEYNRIYTLFYEGFGLDCSVCDIIEEYFESLPGYLRNRTISLSDFDETYGFLFEKNPKKLDADYLISFCEYVWNLSNGILKHGSQMLSESEYEKIRYSLKIVFECMEALGHKLVTKDKLAIFVPQKMDVIAVSEIVKKEVAVNILEYHHHNLKGNLSKKKSILKLMADDIEPERQDLRNINSKLESQLFQVLNKFIRHSEEKTPYISTMSDKDIELVYDDVFQMWLLAKLEIDHYKERKTRITNLLNAINE